MRGPAETIRAAVNTSAITIDGIIEGNVRTIVAADDCARFCLFENFDFRGRRLADPFDRLSQPRIRWISDDAHACNSVLSMQHRIAHVRIFGESTRSVREGLTGAQASSLAVTRRRDNAATGTVALQSYPVDLILGVCSRRLLPWPHCQVDRFSSPIEK